MTPKQKAIELLSQMPEPFKTWALENLEKYPVEIESEPKSISDAIGLFFWTDTPPGFKFWGRVQRHYQYGTPLPELPIEYRYEQLQKENEELKRKVEKLESKLLYYGKA